MARRRNGFYHLETIYLLVRAGRLISIGSMSAMAKLFCILLLFASPTLHAEILKLAIQDQSGIQFYWWPVLPKVDGWHHDREYSIHYGLNAQAPDGFDFGNAETVIYAKAIYKPRVPEIKTLAGFIANDHQVFESRNNVVIAVADSLKNADGIELLSFTFTPKIEGNWEQVAYGEEGEFYVLFTISSRTQAGFNRSLSAYRAIVNRYRR